ncbi:MAG: glycosyltransferase family 9 protein [Deltaproteobacteria bacterium]|nr:glycosyltransferase family 9 protein [Deltaproteobacteria bacterium]
MIASPVRPEKILIIHLGGIGDLLLTLPTLRIFRQAFPRSTLKLMGHPERLSLVAFDLQAKSLHSIDQAGMSYFYAEGELLQPGLSDFFSSFGVVLTFGKTSRGSLSENLKRAGVGRIILLPSFPAEELEIHVSDYLVESLKISGIGGENSFSPLRLPEEAMSFARGFLGNLGWKEGERVLAIHPGSGSPAKNWSPENFVRVADGVSERAKVLLISGPANDGVEKVKKALKKADSFVVDNLPLIHLAALLQTSTAYLGNDSGITHLAAALGIPTVAIFGPTDPAIWGPRGPGVWIFYDRSSCSPCSSEARSACFRQCLKSIDPDRVIKLLSPFFG